MTFFIEKWIIKKTVHQGEILMLLSKRSKIDGIEIAKRMGISRNYLSDSYRRQSLSRKIKSSASLAFGVNESVFETGLGYEIPESREDRVGDDGEEYRSIMVEVERLRAENARLAVEILRERQVSDDLRKTLLLIAGKEKHG